jgi:hypothetical protein
MDNHCFHELFWPVMLACTADDAADISVALLHRRDHELFWPVMLACTADDAADGLSRQRATCCSTPRHKVSVFSCLPSDLSLAPQFECVIRLLL